MKALLATADDSAWTAFALGVPTLIVSLAWVFDLGGMTTRSLQFYYRKLGRLLWPSGSEESYVDFMRFSGVFAVFIGALAVIVGLTRL
jgi:hypothetical protein